MNTTTNPDGPGLPRLTPPAPTVAWFLGDLIPDRLWAEFDIGSVRSEPISAIQAALFAHGGRAAWLRFVEETRAALPRLFHVSLFDMIGPAVDQETMWPSEIMLHCRPVVTVHACGRPLHPAIVLNCHARLSFHRAGKTLESSGDYVLADAEIVLRHERRCVIDMQRGQYYVPVPHAHGDGTAMRRDGFAGFGAPRPRPPAARHAARGARGSP